MKARVPILALLLALTPFLVVHPVHVHGRSMEPTLKHGQVCWVLRAWAAGPPARGEAWVVESIDGPTLKRVLALPGERLEMREGDLFQNDRRLEEPYVTQAERGTGGPWTAGGGYLVLGDNRPESRDSRAWGPVPRDAFRGRILGLHR